MNPRNTAVLLLAAMTFATSAHAQAKPPAKNAPAAKPAVAAPAATAAANPASQVPDPSAAEAMGSSPAKAPPAAAPKRAASASASSGGLAYIPFSADDPEGPGGKDAWPRIRRWEDHPVQDVPTTAIPAFEDYASVSDYNREMSVQGARTQTVIGGSAY